MPRAKLVFDMILALLVILAGINLARPIFKPTAGATESPILDFSGMEMAADKVRNFRGSGTVALVEFSDFECPFCGRHAREVGRQIDTTYVDRQLLTQVFMNFPLPSHQHAASAAEAAECAAKQLRFWEMYTTLFDNQRALSGGGLRNAASRSGLNETAYDQCMKDSAIAARVELDVREGRRLGVISTPTFLLGTVQTDGSIKFSAQIQGAQSFDVFKKAIDELLAVRQTLLPPRWNNEATKAQLSGRM